MREIKFRALFFPDNEWVDFTLEDIAKLGNIFINYKHWRICTGLKDKNGVEIYDGDIIKYTYRDYTVVVKPLERGRYSAFWDFSDFLDPSDNELGAEVIGNIYENPELLEDKK